MTNAKQKKYSPPTNKMVWDQWLADQGGKNNPYWKGWDKWYSSKTFKQHKAEEDRMKCDPVFLSAFQALQEAHPLLTRTPSGFGCREFRNKVDEYTWTKFCEERRIELRPLMWGNIQKVMNPFYKKCPTVRQARDFLPVQLLVPRLAFGTPDKRKWGSIEQGHREAKKVIAKRNSNIVHEYRAKIKKGRWPKHVIGSIAEREGLAPSTVRGIVRPKKQPKKR
jgi:hypothetical protein